MDLSTLKRSFTVCTGPIFILRRNIDGLVLPRISKIIAVCGVLVKLLAGLEGDDYTLVPHKIYPSRTDSSVLRYEYGASEESILCGHPCSTN